MNQPDYEKGWLCEVCNDISKESMFCYPCNSKRVFITKRRSHKKKGFKVVKNKGKCFYCGGTGHMTKDHFYPKSKGGMWCVPCCRSCNNFKADLTPIEFICKLKRMIRATEEGL